MATAAQRHHMHGIMDLLSRYGSQLDYPPHDVRGPLDSRTFNLSEQQMEHVLAAGGRLMGDCSEFATEICKWAGLADPNGLAYRYAGYTGTMLAHLPHYTDARHALTGALAVFGRYPGHHVVLVKEPDAHKGDPLVWSHGRPGVDVVRLSEMAARQPSPVTLLSIAHL